MIKGAQKQMIVVRTANSHYFDEAYFVLRREIDPRQSRQSDMLTEANRILAEHTREGDTRKRKRLPRGGVFFLLGILCGTAAALAIFLLFF